METPGNAQIAADLVDQDRCDEDIEQISGMSLSFILSLRAALATGAERTVAAGGSGRPLERRRLQPKAAAGFGGVEVGPLMPGRIVIPRWLRIAMLRPSGAGG